ncbi:hypothetical protein [Demequina litorisediminis]|uniref:Uncharacterized protein n=1 Tax=Demequina litorisediminis TaxID=1849022 RepID=A0ABQ6I8E9_9MICO|nr:hypothetical protein GCM10025876_01900 [Demequina litorisediminis]
MYTIVPIIAIGVLFKYTAEDIAFLTDVSAEPDVEIQVVGKQWSLGLQLPHGRCLRPGRAGSTHG